jgi:hypothetical protein
MTSTQNTTLAKREVYVNEITFQSRNEISLFGFIYEGGKYYETQYVISRKDLQMLLSSSKTGIELLWHIENLFMQPHQVPATLNLIDLFGTTQVFEASRIELDAPLCEDEAGELIPDQAHDLFFVEKVVPFCLSKNSF